MESRPDAGRHVSAHANLLRPIQRRVALIVGISPEARDEVVRGMMEAPAKVSFGDWLRSSKPL